MIKRRSGKWRGGVSARHWRISVEEHCRALLDQPIASISLEDVLAILKPLYDRAPNFAAITRARLQEIFGYARAYGIVARDKPSPSRNRTCMAAA